MSALELPALFVGIAAVTGAANAAGRRLGVGRDRRLVGTLGVIGGLLSLSTSRTWIVDGAALFQGLPQIVRVTLALVGAACTFASAGAGFHVLARGDRGR